MSITRRTLCNLPALVPLALELTALADNDHAITSGVFTFDKAPMHVANNNAQIQLMVRSKLSLANLLKSIRQRFRPVARQPHPRTTILTQRGG
jgi:hypothetical protein